MGKMSNREFVEKEVARLLGFLKKPPPYTEQEVLRLPNMGKIKLCRIKVLAPEILGWPSGWLDNSCFGQVCLRRHLLVGRGFPWNAIRDLGRLSGLNLLHNSIDEYRSAYLSLNENQRDGLKGMRDCNLRDVLLQFLGLPRKKTATSMSKPLKKSTVLQVIEKYGRTI